jgi:hypothetical protein
VIPSIHYLAILPVLIFFGARWLLVVAALVRTKVHALVATATFVPSRWPGRRRSSITFFQWRCVARHGASTTIAHAIVLDGFSVVATAAIAAQRDADRLRRPRLGDARTRLGRRVPHPGAGLERPGRC